MFQVGEGFLEKARRNRDTALPQPRLLHNPPPHFDLRIEKEVSPFRSPGTEYCSCLLCVVLYWLYCIVTVYVSSWRCRHLMGTTASPPVIGLDRQLGRRRPSAASRSLVGVGAVPAPHRWEPGPGVRRVPRRRVPRWALPPLQRGAGHAEPRSAAVPGADASPVPDHRQHPLPKGRRGSGGLVHRGHGGRVPATTKPLGFTVPRRRWKEQQQQQQQLALLCIGSSSRSLVGSKSVSRSGGRTEPWQLAATIPAVDQWPVFIVSALPITSRSDL